MWSYRSWVDRMLDGFRGEPDAIVVRDASRSLDLEGAACAHPDVVYAVALPGEAGDVRRAGPEVARVVGRGRRGS